MINSTYSSSKGWYTNRTSAVSTVVCCELTGMSLGKDARSESILERGIGRNWRDSRAVLSVLPPYRPGAAAFTMIHRFDVSAQRVSDQQLGRSVNS